jgi:hypothetical protein
MGSGVGGAGAGSEASAVGGSVGGGTSVASAGLALVAGGLVAPAASSPPGWEVAEELPRSTSPLKEQARTPSTSSNVAPQIVTDRRVFIVASLMADRRYPKRLCRRIASAMFPVTLTLPCINALMAFNSPLAIATKS